MSILAGALAVGIAAGLWWSGPAVWPWVAAGSAALGGALAMSLRPNRFSVVGIAGVMGLIAVAVVSFGAMWTVVRLYWVEPDDLSAGITVEPRLLRVRGRALDPPHVQPPFIGTLSGFGHNPPSTWFAMRVTALIGRDGRAAPARGTVLVRVDELVAPFAAGDLVEALGLVYRPLPPGNPGEFDALRVARATGRAGLLVIARRELLSVTPVRGPAAASAVLRARAALRRRAGGWLLSDLPATSASTDQQQRDALLAALLLGQRGRQLDGLSDSFRGAGLSHFLAISGLHLGVLAGLIFFLLRLGGGVRRWHAWLVIAVVLVYLVVVEVRMPVLRAGVMTSAACLGLAAGRRLLVSSLVAGSAVGLLLWRPDQLFAPGFQLSFGVVLGLIHLAPRLRARWFGMPDAFAATSAEMLWQWVRTAAAASVTAWAIATPITLYHWGVLWPLAAPFSVVLLPLVTLVLALGYLKIAMAILLPSAALVTAVPLALGAEVIISLVRAMEAVGLSAVRLVPPPAVWSVAALFWVTGWAVLGDRIGGFWGGRRGRLTLRLAGLALVAWLAWPMLPPALRFDRTALRIDMLAVGDGSCFVLRSGASTVVFDAGSSSVRAAGRRVIVPALRRLGVRSIDAVVISHPNLDHYAAVLDLADAFSIGEVLVTPQAAREAEQDPFGPVMFLLGGLAERSVRVLEVAAGVGREFGSCRWSWLNPEAAAPYDESNDGSMVIRIETAGRSVLLCGDIQAPAMKALGDLSSTDIVELPHHGSVHATAEAFMAALDPRVVLQSTGRGRWRRTDPNWSEVLAGSVRLVTARDGACRVEIDRSGKITVGRFLGDTISGHDDEPYSHCGRPRLDGCVSRRPAGHHGAVDAAAAGPGHGTSGGAPEARVPPPELSPAGAAHPRR